MNVGDRIEIVQGRDRGTTGVVVEVGPPRNHPKYGDVTHIRYRPDNVSADTINSHLPVTDAGLIRKI